MKFLALLSTLFLFSACINANDQEKFSLETLTVKDMKMAFVHVYSGEDITDVIDDCGSIKYAKEAVFSDVTGYPSWLGDAGSTPVISADLSGYIDGLITIKWINLQNFAMSQEAIDNEKPRVVRIADIMPKQCADGSWVISDSLQDQSIGGYQVELSRENTVLGSQKFSLVQ